MKRKSTHKTNNKQTSIPFLDKIKAFLLQILSFIFGVISNLKKSFSHRGKKNKEDNHTDGLIPRDDFAEKASKKAKALLKLVKALIKEALSKIKIILILAIDAIKEAFVQAEARRSFNKAAKKAAKERRAEEEQTVSPVEKKPKSNNAKAKQISNKTKTKQSTDKTKSKTKTKETKEKKVPAKKKKPISIYRRVASLLIKIAIFALSLVVVFGYIFGLSRNQSLNMQPTFQDGDLILYLRLYNNYKASDTILIWYEDKAMIERVIAVAGDTVDITEAGLIVNGGTVREDYAWGETTQFEQGVTFPLTVPEGKIFVLGDNREHATDSRILGCINESDVGGSVIGTFRRRNF